MGLLTVRDGVGGYGSEAESVYYFIRKKGKVFYFF